MPHDTLSAILKRAVYGGRKVRSYIKAPHMYRYLLAGSFIVLSLLFTLSANAHEFSVGEISIDHPWSRATPAGAKVGGAYFVVTNNGTQEDTLLSATSNVAGRVEFHEMSTADGVMKMAKVAVPLVIRPGQSLAFAPSGLHMMLFELSGPLKEGDSFEGTLMFEKAGAAKLVFKIDKMGAKAPSANPNVNKDLKIMDHEKMGHVKN